MDLRAFKQLLRYWDGGTMVLAAPEELVSAAPGEAKPPSSTALDNGDSVLLAKPAGNRVVLTTASVVIQTEELGRPAVWLQTTAGRPVVGGDSGGGVWKNGRLAATTWATVMREHTATGEQRVTNLSVAALYNSKSHR